MRLTESFDVESKLAQRLEAVANVLLDAPPELQGCLPAHAASILLDLLIRAVQSDLRPDRLWLLFTAVFGGYPSADEMAAGSRFLQLVSPIDAALWLLDRGVDRAAWGWSLGEMEIVTDRVVVDVHYSARYDLHTGIQQLARRTVPRWEEDHPILPVAWINDGSAWRTLSNHERERVTRGGAPAQTPASEQTSPRMVAPWHTVVALVETPPIEACGALAALAQYSGSAVVAVGHDCIPVVSADMVPAADTQRFSRYLTVLKYSRRIAGVSRSAATEFDGFASALAAQGLPGPEVVECREAAEFGTVSGPDTPLTFLGSPSATPLVLCVASFEPRKNHLALLYAAERLWREGLRFRLLLIAPSGWSEDIPARVNQLSEQGRPIVVKREVADAELASAYQAARFTVLTSLHEGYGLPVVESLAFGTPVLTTNYGSTEEIASDGGALLVDPRDDEAIVHAMRQLLTDDALLEELRGQIRARPSRTWDQYAADLWDQLVQPELENVKGTASQ
jgi:glycosyltransferase involved in cell wall biosynthesis